MPRLPQAAARLKDCYAAEGESIAHAHFAEFQKLVFGWLLGQAMFLLAAFPQRNRQERAEEAAQVVLIRVWRTWAKPNLRWQEQKGSLSAWLTGLLRNALTDLHRSEARFGPALGDSEARPEESIADPRGSPVDDLAVADVFVTFLAGLDAGDRQLLQLKLLEDMTQEEIGTQLGMSNATVSRRLKALKRLLASRLGHDFTD